MSRYAEIGDRKLVQQADADAWQPALAQAAWQLDVLVSEQPSTRYL